MNLELIREGRRFAGVVIPSKLIAKGSFAFIFEIDDHRVLKLTCDPANTAILERRPPNRKSRSALPVVFEDLGMAAQCPDCLYYGCVMERLYPPTGHEAADFIRISSEIREYYDVERWSPLVDAEFLRALSRAPEVSMQEELCHVADLVEENGWLVDQMNRGNIMERQNGELCLSDPIYSLVPFIRSVRSR